MKHRASMPSPTVAMFVLLGVCAALKLSAAGSSCPAAPKGLRLHPSHCIGPSIFQDNCGTPLETKRCNTNTTVSPHGAAHMKKGAAAAAGTSPS